MLTLTVWAIPCWLLDNHYKSLLFFCYCLVMLALLRHLLKGSESRCVYTEQKMVSSKHINSYFIWWGTHTSKCWCSQRHVEQLFALQIFKKWSKHIRAQSASPLSFVRSGNNPTFFFFPNNKSWNAVLTIGLQGIRISHKKRTCFVSPWNSVI